ncbi:MAG: DUF3135 domain-containing protein [Gammaproteobacteria bacterium]|nr:DUF3135 domain-containing protein [Gammaproteobacteria bacterium]
MMEEDERIDFDSWQHLADSNPEAFEAKRRDLVNAIIEQVPEPRQHRLRCLQWRIEKVCATSSNPISAALRLSRMMWESIDRQHELIQRLAYAPEQPARRYPPLQAAILNFPGSDTE